MPAVLALAALTLAGWLVAGDSTGTALLHATAVVLIACPCALGLATPAAIIAGTGRAAELGALFNDAEVFERAHRIDIVLLDKTGTVTEGCDDPRATSSRLPDVPTTRCLALAAAVEAGSEHPIATAVREGARSRGVIVPDAQAHRITPGSGAEAVTGQRTVSVGPARLAARSSGIGGGASGGRGFHDVRACGTRERSPGSSPWRTP